MGILVDKNSNVIVQGITGYQGGFHTMQMIEYGTKIVAGVTPGKGGEQVHGVPVYDTIAEALNEHDANASICFVPGQFAKNALLEAIDHNLNPITVITEHIPVHDTMRIVKYAQDQNINIIGPNTPGIITPGECKIGIMPAHVFKKGNIGIISRSGTLTYEIAANITESGFGQSTCVGLGGDQIIGLNFIDLLKLFEKDDKTDAVVIIGEIGGRGEEDAAEYIKKFVTKPTIAYIAGRTAPPGKRMGHAGAIISNGLGTAESKINVLKDAGVHIAEFPHDVPKLLKSLKTLLDISGSPSTVTKIKDFRYSSKRGV